MAKLVLTSYPAERDGLAIGVTITRSGEPVARKVVEIKNTVDALREFVAYRAEVEATGKGAAVSMFMAKGERAPKGFKTLTGVRTFEPVNI